MMDFLSQWLGLIIILLVLFFPLLRRLFLGKPKAQPAPQPELRPHPKKPVRPQVRLAEKPVEPLPPAAASMKKKKRKLPLKKLVIYSEIYARPKFEERPPTHP